MMEKSTLNIVRIADYHDYADNMNLGEIIYLRNP